MINVGMWVKALQVIPRIDKEEWDHLDVVSRWLIATRAAVIIMTFISAAIGGFWAFRDGQFNFIYWVLTALGLMFAHATNNILNDITDYKKGVDENNYFRTQYGPQPLSHGLMTIRESWTYAAVTGCIALLLGSYLVYMRGSLALALLAAGAFFVLFYTYPLKYIGLGEIAVIIVWGPLMIGGAYFIVTGQWSWESVLVGLPYALGTTGVIFGKHIDKLRDDKAKNIHTLPVIIGERNARFVLAGATALQYLLVAYLVITRVFTPVMLIVFLAFPMFVRFFGIYLKPRPESAPALMEIPRPWWLDLLVGQPFPPEGWPMWFVAYAFIHNRRFGILFLVGLIIDVVLHSSGVF